MKKSILSLSIVLLLPVVVLSNEPSAYGSSNEPESKASYGGITTTDRKIFQNNEKIPTPTKNVNNSRIETNSANNEEYEGMRSVMDGYGSKIAKTDERIRLLEKSNSDLVSEVNQLKEYLAESKKVQTENQEKIKVVLGELSSLIDSINKNYVPKDKFDQLANEVRGKTPVKPATPDATKKDTTKEKPITAKELSLKDSATLVKEADELFDKKSYTESKVLYDELLHRNYKPAKVNFNLGEIAYNQKSYTAAIEYYKASIALFDKASYTPSLLHHTGISFEKLGKTKESQSFFKALKDGYPDSPEAKKVK